MQKKTLVIASRNMHKIRELRGMLKGRVKWDILSLIDFPDYEPPEEMGETFEENAILKATHAAEALKAWTLADDSGLVVPALGGAPGVRSARFAGNNATDKDNREKLLEEMSSLMDHQRDAYFVCCVALAAPEGLKKSTCAQCEGTILEAERGSQGFGYDCLFLKHDYGKTFAQLEEDIKNRISHRRKALDKLLNLSAELNG